MSNNEGKIEISTGGGWVALAMLIKSFTSVVILARSGRRSYKQLAEDVTCTDTEAK